MKLMEKFKKGLFTKTQFIVGVTITMLTTSLVVYAVQALIGMKVFTSGTPISSADMNANFAVIDKMVEDTNQKFSVGITTSPNFPTYTNYSTSLASVTPLHFDTAFYDYTVGTLGKQLVNVGSFTVTEAGLYDVTLVGRTAGTISGYIHVYKNTSPMISLSVYSAPNFMNNKVFIEAGSVIRVRARATCCGVGPLMTLDPAKTRLLIHKL